MKTQSAVRKVGRSQPRTSRSRFAAGSTRHEKRKNFPLRPAATRSGYPLISLRFEVTRPPAKNGQDASKETSSRFNAAYAVFRQRHPNRVPLTGRHIPPTKCSPLEYVEWAIWKARERWHDATWDNWFLGFYENLVKSDSLKEVCQERCKSPDAAHALLGLLLWDADRFERANRTRKHAHEPVEHSIREEQTEEALGRTSEPDAKQLLKIQELVKSLTCDYILEVSETRKPATGHTRQHQKTLAEIVQGFMEAFAKGAEVRTPVYPDAAKQSTGRSEAGVTSRDMFCALVSHFVQEAFRGEDHIGQTISIMKDFAPGLLKDNHSDPKKETTAFVQRLKTSRKKAGAIKEFNALVTIYKTHRSFPSIMKTFQYE